MKKIYFILFVLIMVSCSNESPFAEENNAGIEDDLSGVAKSKSIERIQISEKMQTEKSVMIIVAAKGGNIITLTPEKPLPVTLEQSDLIPDFHFTLLSSNIYGNNYFSIDFSKSVRKVDWQYTNAEEIGMSAGFGPTPHTINFNFKLLPIVEWTGKVFWVDVIFEDNMRLRLSISFNEIGM